MNTNIGGIEVRMYVLLKEPVDKLRKVMVYESEYDTQEDKHCFADLWFITLDDAIDHCIQEFNVIQEQWVVINDPKEGEYHDIIH